MDLKFKLIDNQIFDFRGYTKYSEYIENLEREPEVIINVLEPFTIEQFETAHLEYQKYVVFKEVIEDIKSNRKLWSKEELIEFSKYNLNNSILEWLKISETTEDKEIKDFIEDIQEVLEFISLKNMEILKDNIILYYLLNDVNQLKFNFACNKNHLQVAQWFYTHFKQDFTSKDEIKAIDEIKEGDEIKEEIINKDDEDDNDSDYSYLVDDNDDDLISLGDRIDIHFRNDKIFLNCSYYGSLDVMKWLYEISQETGGINIHMMDDLPFSDACEEGHFEMARWLYDISKSSTLININSNNYRAFRMSCISGKLEIAQWLYELSGGNIDIHLWNDFIFIHTCKNGHLEVAQWLYLISQSSGGLNIHTQNNEAFKSAIQNGHLDIAQWLYSLGVESIESIESKDIQILFKYSCGFWILNFEMSQWLYSIFNPIGKLDFRTFDIKYIDDLFRFSSTDKSSKTIKWLYELAQTSRSYKINLKKCLNEAVYKGNLEIIQWLNNLDDIQADYKIEEKEITTQIYKESFINSCREGHLEVAQWIFSKNTFEEMVIQDAFKSTCFTGNLEVAQWLYELLENPSFLDEIDRDEIIKFNVKFGNFKFIKWIHKTYPF
jgi:hypothetical protein